MHKLAPWTGRTLVDLGCGFGLPGYAAPAQVVFGTEPDRNLLPLLVLQQQSVIVPEPPLLVAAAGAGLVGAAPV
jgi:predicted RNA methylase